MDRYIEQLIEDVRSASRKKCAFLPEEFISLETDATVVDCHAIASIEGLLGVSYEYLPKEVFFSEEDLVKLVDEIIKALKRFGLVAHFPDDLPTLLKYYQLREHWCSPVYPVEGEEVDIEFCDFQPHDCPFRSSCQLCQKMQSSSKFSA